MKKNALQDAEKYLKANQKKKRWYKMVTSLACIVVFCTVYALILPAITLEKSADGTANQIHTHTDECYSTERGKLICTEHVHTEECYEETNVLVCTEDSTCGQRENK